jgi:hypothetical protein
MNLRLALFQKWEKSVNYVKSFAILDRFGNDAVGGLNLGGGPKWLIFSESERIIKKYGIYKFLGKTVGFSHCPVFLGPTNSDRTVLKLKNKKMLEKQKKSFGHMFSVI